MSCVQNSFWSPERELKAYVGAYVRLRFPRFCLRHNNFKELAYASLTENFPSKPKSEVLVKTRAGKMHFLLAAGRCGRCGWRSWFNQDLCGKPSMIRFHHVGHEWNERTGPRLRAWPQTSEANQEQRSQHAQCGLFNAAFGPSVVQHVLGQSSSNTLCAFLASSS